MTVMELEIYGLLGRLNVRDVFSDVVEPVKNVRKKSGEGQRKTTRLQDCHDALSSWRKWRWLKDYEHCAWGPEALLPDPWLEILAKGAHIKTVDSIKATLPDWGFADAHGAEVLDRLVPIDNAWMEDREGREDDNKAKRSRVSKANKLVRDEKYLVAGRQRTAAAAASSSRISSSSQASHLPAIQPLVAAVHPFAHHYPPPPMLLPPHPAGPYNNANIMPAPYPPPYPPPQYAYAPYQYQPGYPYYYAPYMPPTNPGS